MEVAKAKPCNDTASSAEEAAGTSHVSEKLKRDDSKEIARLAKKMKILSNLVTPKWARYIKTFRKKPNQFDHKLNLVCHFVNLKYLANIKIYYFNKAPEISLCQIWFNPLFPSLA